MVKVNILKPVYGNFVYIRNTYINEALKKGVDLEITVPNGTATVNPNEWLKGAKRLEKEFRIPGHPMILFGNHVRLED